MDLRNKIIEADFTWTGRQFERRIQLKINGEGRIVQAGRNLAEAAEVFRLVHQAISPGFVNCHSHAFHRAMRGRSRIGSSDADSFWKWRDDMYRIVEYIQLQYCETTFEEMLRAGITTVGEFHYVHHGTERFELDAAVCAAADRVGIRLVLICTYYRRAGFGQQTIAAAQRRFVSTLEEFINQVEELKQFTALNPLQTIAVAAHSVRAVEEKEMAHLIEWTKARKMPMHMHLEEQPRELDDCRTATGSSPVQLLLRHHPTELFTAVHCTYTEKDKMHQLAERKINVCICPLTEGYLGDGIPQLETSDNLCLGTDCNNRISMLEEMRWLAYCQQMKHNSRSQAELTAERLLDIATVNGARSMGLAEKVGRLQPDYWADFVSFDLRCPATVGLEEEQIADGLVFGGGNEDVKATVVAGIVRYGSV